MSNLASRSLAVAFVLLALAACSTDTPTAPERTPAPPPYSGTTTIWNISVTADPRNLTAGDSQPATITIRVRRSADGVPPPNGTSIVVGASLGDFNSSGSDQKTATVFLGGGVGQILYFAGSLLGTDTIAAQLESSVGTTRINILEPEELFIESVRPSSGPEGGGTRIRISGTGFTEPARVELGSGGGVINATVDRVGEDSEGGFIRAITGAVFDPAGFFETETCDSDGDGTLDGDRYLPTTVNLQVILTSGSATLSNAFTYLPDDTSCRERRPDPDRPKAQFTFTTNGLTVLFDNQSTPPGLTFDWIFGDGVGTSTEANPVYTYAAAGTYTVTLRATNSSGSSTTSKDVTVSP